jgi:hypothetical protein
MAIQPTVEEPSTPILVDLKAIEIKIEQINEFLASEPNSPADPNLWRSIRRTSSAGSRPHISPPKHVEVDNQENNGAFESQSFNSPSLLKAMGE